MNSGNQKLKLNDDIDLFDYTPDESGEYLSFENKKLLERIDTQIGDVDFEWDDILEESEIEALKAELEGDYDEWVKQLEGYDHV